MTMWGVALFLSLRGAEALTLNKVKGKSLRRSNLEGAEVAKYTIILEPNYPEEGYTVRVPALPGCITYGRTREEALARAKEAIEDFIEGLEKAGDPVPEEITPVEMDTVSV